MRADVRYLFYSFDFGTWPLDTREPQRLEGLDMVG